MANRLAGALSPYLLQHAGNPVDWWPWCDEAFTEARRRDVPVLLSVGYAACHWCHVMAHESFEDPTTAAVMNDRFINVKVDREERPDIDAVYMAATLALTGGGGWPMTVFLDGQGRAFFAGTYFPPLPTRGRPSFLEVLHGIDRVWRTDRDRVRRAVQALDAALDRARWAPEAGIDPGGVGEASAARGAQVPPGPGPEGPDRSAQGARKGGELGGELGGTGQGGELGGELGGAGPGGELGGELGGTGQGGELGGELGGTGQGGELGGAGPGGAGLDVLAGGWGQLQPDELAEVTRAVSALHRNFDAVWGGFGAAPKFPPSMVLEFLLRADALTGAAGQRDPRALAMAESTMVAMARGGIYDQLAGGFARYSVDASWVVPHFEKMLYDNALLLRVYLHRWRATGDPLAKRVVQETAGFLLTELRTDEGGFASSLDADSEGREGACYVWTRQQLDDVLGPSEGAWAAALLRVTDEGTFEAGGSVLQRRAEAEDERWDAARRALLAARRERTQPARDGKVVAAWNGLAIAALAEAGALLDQPSWVQAATECATLLADVHWDPAVGAPAAGASAADRASVGADADVAGTGRGRPVGPSGAPGRLARVSLGGRVADHARGVLEDYADLAEGLLVLYQVTGTPRWFRLAQSLLAVVRDQFRDGAGGYFDTAADAPSLVRRPRDPLDGATPAGVSAAANALLMLAALTGDPGDRAAADAALAALRPLAQAEPRFTGWAWAALTARISGPVRVAVAVPGGPGSGALDPLHRAALASTSPGLVVAIGAGGSDPSAPLLLGRPAIGGLATAYPCRAGACLAPVTDAGALRSILDPHRPGARRGEAPGDDARGHPSGDLRGHPSGHPAGHPSTL